MSVDLEFKIMELEQKIRILEIRVEELEKGNK
jgi:hypothetical protein